MRALDGYGQLARDAQSRTMWLVGLSHPHGAFEGDGRSFFFYAPLGCVTFVKSLHARNCAQRWCNHANLFSCDSGAKTTEQHIRAFGSQSPGF